MRRRINVKKREVKIKESKLFGGYIEVFLLLCILLATFCLLLMLLEFGGRKDHSYLSLANLGNLYSWIVVPIWFGCALASLKLPGRIFCGRTTFLGQTPTYKANGSTYYIVTVIIFEALNLYTGYQISEDIYDNIIEIACTWNILTFAISFVVCYRRLLLVDTEHNEIPAKSSNIMMFLKGVDDHPQFCGVDLKQFAHCRIGMMSWQILILAFYYTSLHRNGPNPGITANFVLQSLFIARFFTPETRYFKTMEIEKDKPGYFLIWGSMVFVPFVFSYSTYYLVAHPSLLTTHTSCLLGALGFILILVMFHAKHRKQLFRLPEGNFWGRVPTYNVEIHVVSRRPKKTVMFLYLGYRSRISRHVNFVFEILLSFCWCCPNIGVGISGFLYVIFLIGLFVYRLIIEKTTWRLCRDGGILGHQRDV